MTDPVIAKPFYPASFLQYLKHPSMLVRFAVITVATLAIGVLYPVLLWLPIGLGVLTLGWQYYTFRTLYPKLTVTKTFGDMLAAVSEDVEEPVTSKYVLEITGGRGIAISGEDIHFATKTLVDDAVVSPHASVSQDVVPVSASFVRDEDVVSAEAEEKDDFELFSEADHIAIEAAYRSPISTGQAKVAAADQFITMSFAGNPEKGVVAGRESDLGCECGNPVCPFRRVGMVDAGTALYSNMESDVVAATVRKNLTPKLGYAWPASLEIPEWKSRDFRDMPVINYAYPDSMADKERRARVLGNEVARTVANAPRMPKPKPKRPSWMERLQLDNDWRVEAKLDGGGFRIVRPEVVEEEGKEITLTPPEFHRAACTPDVCVCTSKGFFAAVEATKEDEVFEAPVKMPSALFSRAVERQLEAGKLRQSPDGKVRAVRDVDAIPGGRRMRHYASTSTFPTEPTLTEALDAFVPDVSADSRQRILAEMLKVIPADLLAPDTAPSGAMFDAGSYVDDKGRSGTTAQIDVVRNLMKDNEWRTLTAISASTGFPEASISARLRDLRKTNFGGYTVERRYVSKGLFEYRLAP